MGKDIYDAFPETRAIFESPAAGFDLKEMCYEAPAEKLGDTRYTQAAMAAFAAAVTLVLKGAGLSCDFACGLSLGEYSALHAADVFDAEALLDLLAFRGRIMAEASTAPSDMRAVLGLDDATVEAVVAAEAAKAEAAGLGVVACANFNCPGQVVIGGDAAAVALAEAALKGAGARRVLPLATSGPFHTPLMQPASPKLAEKLAATPFAPQSFPVIFNVLGGPAADDEIKDLLARQICNPVRFADGLRYLESQGVEQIIEIGPGHVLAGLVKKTCSGIPVVSIETAETLKEVIAQ
jgi:[acyl-carrier-protein] S-malonyltransferase